ncbi:MAG: aryl-sulfate sulfotransferase [Saprospiraceae bacterium]
MKRIYTYIFFLTILLLSATKTDAQQNTVGLLSYDITQSYQGYTMIYPHNQPNVYLIDNCGEIVHTWTDDENFRPGNTAYLRPDGSLIKTKRDASIAGDNIWAGGGGAFIETYDWDSNLLNTFEMNNDTMRLHHDIAVMPNGNVLAVAWELKTQEEAIENGRDTDLLSQEELWPDMIIELDPETGEIVWEWHAWDHLIQDFDDTKANFGVVADHDELINLNWDTNDGKSDWMHVNALDYNAELDQIMISVPTFHEVWVIDHSTSTEQAAGHSGGTSNHGGDILYRVGNPAAYGRGDADDQILFYQHDTHWANEFLPNSHPFKDHVVCFNNRIGDDFSTIEIFEPSWDMYAVDYLQLNNVFPPSEFSNTIMHPGPRMFHSTGLSSAQILPNGNMLACSGRQGYIVEMNAANEIVWEYITPLVGGQPATQGDTLEINNNLTFRAFRYPPEYSAFDNRDLSSKGFIESEPDEGFCDRVVSIYTPEEYNVEIFPNPARDMVHLSWDSGKIIDVEIYDMMGRLRLSESCNGGMKYLDVSSLEPNMYVLRLEGIGVVKLMIE